MRTSAEPCLLTHAPVSEAPLWAASARCCAVEARCGHAAYVESEVVGHQCRTATALLRCAPEGCCLMVRA